MNDARHFLVVSHTGRPAALEATSQVCAQLLAAGAVPVIAAEQWDDVHAAVPSLNGRTRRFEHTREEHIELRLARRQQTQHFQCVVVLRRDVILFAASCEYDTIDRDKCSR